MKLAFTSLTHRPPVIIFGLLVVAVLAFAGVGRLVHRFRAQEEALARHLYQRGVKAQTDGHAEEALGAFRAALSYSRDNFQYQLSLARALRDIGRTAESETYLIRLWERSPQEAHWVCKPTIGSGTLSAHTSRVVTDIRRSSLLSDSQS